jgi:cobalt-zinc-cadmium efflux system membrane fusion protein
MIAPAPSASRGPRTVRLDAASLARLGVRVDAAGAASASLAIEVPGTLGFDLERYAEVGAPLGGRVTSLRAKVGDAVKKGAVLATVLVPEAAGAQADYLAARASSESTRRELAREEALQPHGATSDRELTAARHASARAEAALAAAAARLHVLRLPLPTDQAAIPGAGTIQIVAPIDGVVVERRATLGQFLPPEDTAFVVADLASLWAALEVHESDVPYLRAGADVALRVEAAGGRVVTGRVALVEPVVGRATRTVRARLVVPNADGALRPGAFVRASIRLPDATGGAPGVVVPAEAVQPVADEDVVFLERAPGVFELRAVEIRRRSADLVELARGVTAGDRVAVAGTFLLRGEAMKQ